jgi:hypothetical protein
LCVCVCVCVCVGGVGRVGVKERRHTWFCVTDRTCVRTCARVIKIINSSIVVVVIVVVMVVVVVVTPSPSSSSS